MRLSVAIFKWQSQENIHFNQVWKRLFSVKFNLVFQFDADVGLLVNESGHQKKEKK